MKFLKIGLVTAVMTSATLFVAPAIADNVPVDTPTCVEVGYTQVTDWTTGPAPGPDWVLDQTRTTPTIPGYVEEKVVVDKEAYDEVVAGWQRYSWNGPWRSNTEAPPFPNEHWQPNVKGDPHGVGVEGPYFRSNGNSGNGDWFYLKATENIVHHEAETHIEYINHPAVPGVTEYVYTKFVKTTKCTEPPVDECANGGCEHEQPEPGSDPEKFTLTDTTKETKCKPKKCVVIVTDSTGKVVDKSEIVYGNVDEEGF